MCSRRRSKFCVYLQYQLPFILDMKSTCLEKLGNVKLVAVGRVAAVAKKVGDATKGFKPYAVTDEDK